MAKLASQSEGRWQVFTQASHSAKMGLTPLLELAYRHFVTFKTEKEAENCLAKLIAPYCAVLKRQVILANGLKPDIGFRLKVFPDIPLTVEVKNFEPGNGLMSTLVDAIAQANDYSRFLKTPSFIGPIYANGAMELEWTRNVIGSALLVASEFNVGVVMLTPEGSQHRDKIGSLLLGNQVIATFTRDQYGDPVTTLHANARHLLKLKTRTGSATTRRPF